MSRARALDEGRTTYAVAFTHDRSDCIVCPKSYLDENCVTALSTRKPYPIVKFFLAVSSADAMTLGMQIFREERVDVDGENYENACPV